MKIIEAIKVRLKRNRYLKTFLEQFTVKTVVLSILSLAISVGFAVVNLVSAIKYRSIWYGALTGYYAALIFFRGVIIPLNLKYKKVYKDDPFAYETAKLKIYLASGAFLVMLGVAMGVAVTQMVLSDRPAQSGTIMAITVACYAFYKITMSVINLLRAQKLKDTFTQSLRNLNFADALMSMVSLTVLMLSTFGEESDSTFILAMKASVSFAACAIVLGLATYVILSASKKLNREKKNEIE